MTATMITAELVDVVDRPPDGHDDAGNFGVEKFWSEETHSSQGSGW